MILLFSSTPNRTRLRGGLTVKSAFLSASE